MAAITVAEMRKEKLCRVLCCCRVKARTCKTRNVCESNVLNSVQREETSSRLDFLSTFALDNCVLEHGTRKKRKKNPSNNWLCHIFSIKDSENLIFQPLTTNKN